MKKKTFIFSSKVCNMCAHHVKRGGHVQKIFFSFQKKKKKNFQGTILEGGSYIENLKIERQPSKKYQIFNTNLFTIDDD
jgi:hypothetical protein